MYNNFSSKKTKKVISALLASALVVTSGPITADAATAKVVGVKKTFTVSASATNKVTGLSKAEKKVVKVTKKGKKFTVKGLKAGKATFKIGKKSYTVKVGATAVKTAKAKLTLTKGKAATVKFTATAGNGDTVAFASSNKNVTLSKKSAKIAKNVASVKVTAKKAGTAKITATSKATGKKATVTVTVKNAVTPATATPEVTATATATGSATATPEVTVTPEVTATATATGSATATPEVTATATATGSATATPEVTATATATGSATATPEVTATPTATPEVVTASAVSASAVNAKTIAVTFNKELTKDEQNAVKVSVTKEKATQAVKAAFKDAKTLYITRDTDLNFVAGTYTVELSGLTAYKTDVAVEAPVATSLKITSAVLEKGLKTAAIKVSVKDQYGEEIAVTGNDFETATYNGTNMKATYNAQTKAFEIDTTAETLKVNDSVNVVLLYKTGLTATATLKVVQQTYVQNIALGDYVLPVGTTRLTEDVKNVLIPYTATNNYDEVVTLTSAEYSLISTNTAVLDATKVSLDKDTNGKTYFKIANFESAGKTSIIVMNNKNGQTTKVDLDVQEKAGKPYAIQLDASSIEVAQGSTAYVGLTITDKYGDKVAAKDLASADNKLVVGTSNGEYLAAEDVKVITDENDTNYGKLAIEAKKNVENKTAVITITLPNGTNTTLQVKIGAKAVPTTLTAKADKTTMVAGATAKVAVSVKDQYLSDVSALGDYTVVATVADTDKDIVSVTTKAAVSAVPEITVTAKKAGTAKVKVDLQDKDKKVIDTKTVTFTVEANTATNLTYSVDAIPTLYKNTETVTLGAVKNTYAKEITVTAKKADGTTVAIPADKILSVTSDNKVIKADNDSDTSKWYVYGKNESIKEDQTAKLTIVVATDDGSVIVNQNVTVSKEEVKTVAIKLYDQAKSDKAKEISSVSVTTYGAIQFNSENNNYLYTVDQFGNEVLFKDADAVSLSSFNKITDATGDKAKYANSKFDFTAKNGKAEAGASYKVTLVKDGVTASFTVNVTGATK